MQGRFGDKVWNSGMLNNFTDLLGILSCIKDGCNINHIVFIINPINYLIISYCYKPEFPGPA